MFEIMYKKEFYKVYSIRDNGDCYPSDFLIYINYNWMWVSCIHCIPAK